MGSKLIIGDINSIYIKSLIENLKKTYPKTRVDCLSTSRPRIPVININNTYENKISYWWDAKIKTLGSIGWFLGVAWWYLFRTNKIKYDVIQIHFVATRHMRSFFLYKKCTVRIAAILWGSDLLRCNRKSILRRLLIRCDIINCTTDEFYKAVVDLIGMNKVKEKTISKLVFGLAPLEDIKKGFRNISALSDTVNKLGLESSKKIVVVGHNGSEGQQHLKIITSLSAHLFEDVLFVFPMTYGSNTSYKAKIKDALNQVGFHFVVLDEYMSNTEVAALRLVSDIFIQLLVTDGLSGSMQEHLFAKKTVITGAWLPYTTLTKRGIRYLTVKSIDDIGGVLLEELHNPKISDEDKEKNNQEIYNLSAWQNVIGGWNDI